jgi:hypothetical protein
LVVAAAAVLAASGCGPALYHGFQQTRTYVFERKVSVVVRSDPAGATIMTSNGSVIGQAPLILEEKVHVRRRHRSPKLWLMAIGCIVGSNAIATATYYSVMYLPRTFTGLMLITGAGLFWESTAIYLGSSVAHGEEQVIPRKIELVARWDGLADARVELVLPATRLTTLRLPRSYTFDEALALWAREGATPLTGESLYRIGNYYRVRALQGVQGAMARAIEHYTLYLQRHAAAEHADDVRRALEALLPLEGRGR